VIGRNASKRGQSMVEVALLLPVLMLLFLGVWTGANLISDNNAASQATRAGARLGAELGNGGYGNSALAACQGGQAKNPCQVDQEIIGQGG
jgi:Flp pilus assembly protein TadG